MKITKEHYEHMKSEISKVFTKEKDESHRKFIIIEGKSKDIEMRLRHDWKWYAGLSGFICKEIYQYANDTHIDTALKKIMKELRD